MKRLHQLVKTRAVGQIHGYGALACVIAGAALIGAAIPALSQRADRIALHLAVEAADAKLQRTRSQTDKSRKEIAALSAKLQESTGMSATLDRRLLDVSSVAAEFGLQIDSVEPGASVKAADGGSVAGLAVSGRGSYPQVIAYMARLRETAPDLIVQTAQLSSAIDGGCVFQLALNWSSPPANAARQVASVDPGDRP